LSEGRAAIGRGLGSSDNEAGSPVTRGQKVEGHRFWYNAYWKTEQMETGPW
jgi:hypothetical protein